MGAYFVDQNCRTLRTGAEAVLDLQGSHLERKTVQSSLMRGRKQGVVEEIELTDGNMLRFEQFHAETTHGGKPQLQHVFRGQPSRRCRAFVFRTFGGQWLGAMTLSPRGNLEMHTELMLRRRNAPGDIMECLVAGIFETLRSENMGEWSLGEVPFMTLTQGSTDLLTPMEQLMVGIVSRCKHAYDFEGLYRFKNKFSPKWRPITLCVSEEPTTLLLTELAVAMGFAGLLVHESLDLLGQSIRFGFK
ncbi:MAG: DUF2156 domain-containing protein [Chlorobiaceae bacterium]|nr:DUF2156 domain-containing protein [Chlorobiaceae bacterium]